MNFRTKINHTRLMFTRVSLDFCRESKSELQIPIVDAQEEEDEDYQDGRERRERQEEENEDDVDVGDDLHIFSEDT